MNKITLGFFLAKSKTTINRLLVLFVLLLSTQVSWGQGAEDFSNIPASNASYLSRSWTGTNSVTWTATLARTDQTLTGKAICTNGSGTITSPTYSGGMGTLQFNYVRGFTGTVARSIDVYVNNVKQGSTITVSTTSNSVVAYSSAINISGNVILELRTAGSQIKIDDISWTSYSALTTPTLSADATSNTVDNPIDITFTDDSTWRTAVTAVKIGTTTLTSGTDYDLTAGKLQLKPSGLNALLTTSGSKSVTVLATGYTDATVTQVINAGAPTTNSTATISAALAPNTSRTITCTAKDQYNNLVSGYTFGYDVTVTNNTVTTTESYTIDGSALTATSTGNPVTASTNASGVVTFTAALPATIDPSDGLSIQVQLADDSTNVGTAFSFAQLAAQTITFGALSPVTYGGATFGLTATASSTLPVSYASSNTAVATVSGSTVTIVGAGSTNITASQAGDSSYNAAIEVIQALTVNAIALTIPDAVAASRAYNTLFTTNITGTLTGIINSDDVTFDGTLKGTFADANVANGIAVTAACTLAGTKAGNYTLTQPTGLTANITQASQTINFGALANKTVGDADYLPGATSSTSAINPITYASSNTTVAIIVAGQIQILGVGSTNITASQAGNINYAAAIDVVQSLTVVPVPIAAWDFTGVGTTTVATLAATTLDTGLTSTSITRGATAAWSTGANSWRTQGFQNNAISTSNTDYFQITIHASSGKSVSLSTIDANFVGTSSFAVSPGVSSQFTYSLDGTNFTLIGSPSLTIGTPATMTQIDLTAVSALQNVASGTTITLRYYASGQTTTGGWGFSSPTAGTNGLAIGGVTTLVSTTWNGTTWSNGAPTASVDAIIAGDYSVAANITAKTLTVNNNAVATIPSGNNVTVTGAVTVTAPATLTFSNNANLIQGGTTNTNTGNVIVKRNSSLLKRLDYTLWSSPVTNAALFLKAFSPNTLDARFYTYNTTFNTGGVNGAFSLVTSPSTTNFLAGKGYSIRMPDNASAVTPTAYPAEFTGVPNNGDITASLVDGGSAGLRYNLVGNPYPSPISMSTFVTDNSSNIESTLYFWRKTNGSGSAYCTWVPGGGSGTFVTNDNPQAVNPSGIIQTGQGFFVEAKSGATSLIFKNTQRVTNNTGQFFKTKQVAEASKIWLNATNAKGDFSQMAITYFAEATTGVDAFDAKYFNDSPIALTSNINNGEYTIQGRPAFDPTDVVALNFKTNADGDYTIALDHFEGVFTAGQDVYLVDSKTGTETDLKAGAYTFNATTGVDNTRFSLKYQKTLKVDAPAFNENSVSVYKNNGSLYVNSGFVAMSNIKVFDIQGRLVAEQKNLKSTTAVFNNLRTKNQVLIVKISGENNNVLSKKVVN